MKPTVKRLLIGVGVLVVVLAAVTGISSIRGERERERLAQEHEQAIAALASEKEAYDRDHMEAINGTLGRAIFLDALGKLADEGVIDPLPDEPHFFSNVFTWRTSTASLDDVVDFKDESAEAQLTGDYTLPKGKVAIATEEGFVFSTDKGMYYLTGGEEDAELADVPSFYPEGIDVPLDDDIPQSRFANTLDECDYIIAYASTVTHEDPHYYIYGATGHFTTTFVLVFDARSHEVLHLEIIGTTHPDPVVTVGGSPDEDSGSIYGPALNDEASAYMSELLR